MSNDSTWSAPTGEKDKELFYAAGRQPYSIKVGDHWVAINQLGPIGYMMAVPMAYKHHYENEGYRPSDSEYKRLMKFTGEMGKFLSDQSYMKGLGDFVKTVQGDTQAMQDLVANVPRQLVPMSSFLAWTARIIDPVFRKPETPIDSILAGIPYLSKQVSAYTNPVGEESRRYAPFQNSFSPLQFRKANPQFEADYQMKQQKLREDREIDALKSQFDAGSEVLGDKRSAYELEMAKLKVGQSGESQWVDGKLVYDDDGSIRTLDLAKIKAMPEGNEIDAILKRKERFSAAKKLMNSSISAEALEQGLRELNISSDDAAYYYYSSADTEVKDAYVQMELEKFANQSDRQGFLQFLADGRRLVNNQKMISNTRIDDLYKQGVLSDAERKQLKALEYDNKGARVQITGRGRTARLKKITIPKVSAPKMRRLQIKKGISKARLDRVKL
jgi:hypothetical protein